MTDDDLSANLPVEFEEVPPATREHIALSPQLVEAVQEDPELLAKLSRGQLAVVQDRMVRRVLQDPDASITQLATVHGALSSNAQLKPQAGAVASGGGVVINFMVGGKKETVVVEGQAQVENVAPG